MLKTLPSNPSSCNGSRLRTLRGFDDPAFDAQAGAAQAALFGDQQPILSRRNSLPAASALLPRSPTREGGAITFRLTR